MRISSLFGPAAAGLLSLLAVEPATVLALSFNSIPTPELDLSSLGQVSITGDFDGVSLYQYQGQSEITQSNGSQSILTPLPNGILTNLSSSDGQISAMCTFTQKDGSFAGIFVGGNFTTLGGVLSPGAALFNPQTSQVTALPGLSGYVASVVCDQETNRVYAGGSFKHDNTSNAIAWDSGNGWTTLPFDGLNGPVKSVLKADDGHIIFGGSFSGLGNSTSSHSSHGKQILNLQDATITSDAQSTMSGYIDPRNVVCSTSGVAGKGKTWLLYDYSPGFWRAELGFTFNPTKVRLYNTDLEGRGTKHFLFRALPDNGIMNLTYTDSSGNEAHCTSYCPLAPGSSQKYQDFTLVNPVGMEGFQIEIQDWYGQGAGLNGIEVFQDLIWTYAINQYNEPTCAGIDYPSKSTRTGSWAVKSGYVSAQVTGSNAADTSVVFEPDIKESGHYSVLLYTPGCVPDGTCSSRGIVDATATVSSSAPPISTPIYQTNYYDKYDTLYTGYVDASSGSFRPRVSLRPQSGQGDLTVVASSVQFVLLSATGGGSGGGSGGGLNGLYDYDPTSKSTTTHLAKSEINKAGKQLNHGASVTSLVEQAGVIYVGGNFSDPKIHQIMSISDGNATAMPGGGLNSEVLAMTTLNDVLYVGGQFTDTSDGGMSGLHYVAAYSFSSHSWSALGEGLNGPVDSIYPVQLSVSTVINETTIAVSGDFDQIRASNNHPPVSVSGFAIWVPSRNAWLQNLNVTQMEFAGHLSAVASVNNTSILAGNLATDGIVSGDAVSLQNSKDLSLVPLPMKVDHTKSSKGLFTGVYDTGSGRNLTILGGHFTATSSSGSTIENLVLLNGADGTLYGVPSGIHSNSTFISMLVSNNTLWAGGSVTGSVGGTTVGGLVAYDLNNGDFVGLQPSPLNGGGATVNTIVTAPGASNEIYVGGNFQSAGGLPCVSVCYYDSSTGAWTRPGVNLEGNVLALRWTSKTQMIAVGDMTVSTNQTVIATYDAKTQTWSSFPGASKSEMPGPVTAFTPASQDVSTFWLGGTATNGSSFLLSYDGSKFHSPGSLFSAGTVIRGIEILPMSKKHSQVSLLNNDQTLLVMGQLVIPGFGNASAALYNGTSVIPFILSSQSNGQPGSMAQLFSELQNPYTSSSGHLSNGIAVLVAFCCALGCVFLIVLAGVILNKIQRRRQGYQAAPQTFGTDRPSDMQRVPPEYLFNSLRQPNPGAPAI